MVHGYLNLGELAGAAKERTRNLAWQFSQCGVECRVVDHLMEEHWHKLVWNIPFNGLTIAAGRITTADILRDHSLRSAAIALMNEVVVGAESCGYNLPINVVLEQMKRTETMGAYKPSTLLDFEAGRALEIEAIWGEPLRRGQAHGAAMPQLEELYWRLKTLDGRGE